MKEWQNPYNPFNSWKVLYWREHLEAIVKEEFLPPVTVDTDPAYVCNYFCNYCNAHTAKKSNTMMPQGHLLKLADLYKEWNQLGGGKGPYSTCVAGGGEPLLHPDFVPFIYRLYQNGIESGVITNGSLLKNKHIEAITDCSRWCGISVDSGDPKVYSKLKGISPDYFNLVIKNIKKLVSAKEQKNSKVDIAFKFLLHPDNAHTIFEAVKIAKDIGVQDFHLRPVGLDNLEIFESIEKPRFTEETIEIANEQIAKAMELEDKKFHVYGIRHKFTPEFKRKVNFSKCWAIPLLPTFGADGYVHTCFDVRGRKDLILCKHYPDPKEILKIWGTDYHKKIIDSIDPNKCPRCTLHKYQEIIENAVIQDKMCRNFP